MIREYHNHKLQTTHGTARKSHTTVTRHQEDKLSKAISSLFPIKMIAKIVSEYGQEIPQSHTADEPMAPRGRATQQPRDTRKTD